MPSFEVAVPKTTETNTERHSIAREIFLVGQQRGNRANVFSKIGDSITVDVYFLNPIGWGTYNLREYGYLLPTVQYFSTTIARDSNSFSNTSLAANNGWTSAHALNPDLANTDVCYPAETPLACEYRIVKPAVALILFGTNDVSALSAAEYAANLSWIVQVSIDMGVVPVLSTIPIRGGFDALIQEFNLVVVSTAHGYGVPIWDYAAAMNALPNWGLSDDAVHPSWASGGVAAAADFSAENLQYGYPLRNLMALQVLDQLRREVLY